MFNFYKNDRIILHADFDSFFASCEQHFNPNLRNVPIGVTAANGRTCIIAASKEAKKYGVKTASRTFDAMRLCPQIKFVKADFERYLEITRKFIQIATQYSPSVEVFSLDEVFIDLTPVLHLHKSIDDVVLKIKKEIADKIGPVITISCGVSYNKLLAKLASDQSKPDGYFVIDRSNFEKVYALTPFTDICGIGERLKRRLNFLGIKTFKELTDFPMYVLKAEFGNVCSYNLKRIAMGYDDDPVVSYLEERIAKSVGRNYCLPENLNDQKKILQIIFELCEEVAIRLRKAKLKGRTIGLSLSGDRDMHEQISSGRYLNTAQDIFEACHALYKKWKWNSMVRQVRICVSSCIQEEFETPSLFENKKESSVLKALDKINDKLGHHTIRKGYVLEAPKLHTKPNGFLADSFYRKQLVLQNSV